MAERNDRKKSHARKKGKKSSSAGYKNTSRGIDRTVSYGLSISYWPYSNPSSLTKFPKETGTSSLWATHKVFCAGRNTTLCTVPGLAIPSFLKASMTSSTPKGLFYISL